MLPSAEQRGGEHEPRGQQEAARSTGLTRWQTMAYIVLAVPEHDEHEEHEEHGERREPTRSSDPALGAA